MMAGVAEEAAEFRRDDALAGLGRFRRIAGIGPVYEVVGVQGDRASVVLLESGETAELPLDAVLDDPLEP